MSGSALVVLGDTLLDSDITGTVNRLCPDAPAPVVDVSTQCRRPGGAGLAALLAARVGHQVTLVTALGDDPPGRLLADLLAAAGVEVVAMPLRGATACKTRVRAAGRSLLRIDSGDGRAAGGPLADTVQDTLLGAGAVLVADYGRGVTAVSDLRVALAELTCRVPVVWDPHPHGGSPVPGCHLITPNESEATGFVAAPGSVAAVVAARQQWRCSAVAMTLGARGALLATSTGTLAVPVPDIAVAPGSDTCGAGDAFAAAVTGALLDNRSVTEAVTVAVGAASQFVADGGVASIDPLAAGSEMTYPVSTRPGPVARSAQDIAARVRRRGGRLVATGGCFDLLHPGHLSLLRQARALGDGLVVCLNSDESVRRRKGPGRPIVPASGRIALLEALEPVDAVAVFDEDTPAALLAALRPDVWVKGGDYTLGDLPEAPVVSRYGGHTVIIPLVEGYSTSRLVSAARAGS